MLPLTQIRELFARALELSSAERDTLLANLDEEVRAEVKSLLDAHDSAGTFLDSGGAGPFLAGDRVGPYRICEELGRGGMGVVYRAVRDDGEFRRDVAIKVVGGRLFAPELERRFLAERNILAALDHPNIVRMLDGGLWKRQRYLVMEYVAGQPITDYCRERDLSLAERLRLFQTLCAAIQYAHLHLVLHRDLKAANILVNSEGVVKVLDFGIARLQDSDLKQNSDTAGNTILNPLTPSCASPEQLRGEALTLASDIYALGLLLYEILTGKNPQNDATPAEILRMADSGGPIPPGKVDPAISRDLDAIVAKALAVEPARRYGSAAEMAADVERFLENRPVLARAPSRLYSAARLCARNKAMTVIAAALVVAVFGGLAAVLWQARRAEHQRAIAESRFDNARRLIYTVIHDIQPQMASIDGTVSVRKALVEKTLVYLEALWRDSAGNTELTRELIDSYVVLASVAADPGTANTGDQQRASEILAKADRLADALYRSPNPDSASLTTLCHYYQTAARNGSFFGSPDRAQVYARRAVAAAEKRKFLAPNEPVSDEVLAGALMTLAAVISDHQERVTLFERALPMYRSLADRQPSDPHSRNLALVYKNLASAWLDLGAFQRSLESAEKAQALDEAILQHTPSSPEARMALAFDLGAAGWALHHLHRFPEAAAILRHNVALREQLAASNPDDRRASDRLAYALLDLANVEREMGDLAAAQRDLRHTLRLYQALVQRAPLVPQSLYRFALANAALGAIEIQHGEKVQGCELVGKADGLLAEYRQRKPSAGDAEPSTDFRTGEAACAAKTP